MGGKTDIDVGCIEFNNALVTLKCSGKRHEAKIASETQI